MKFYKSNKKFFCQKVQDDIKARCKDTTFFSWAAQRTFDPLPIKTAKGCYMYDYNGKEYFDLNSGLMCSNLGHNHPTIIKEIQKQAESLSFVGPSLATEIRAETTELILQKTPKNIKKIFYTLGGAESTENAIKFARFSTGRHKIMVRYHSYHGATHGAITLTSDPRRFPNEPGMPGVLRTFNPYKYRCPIYREGMSDEEYAAKLIEILEYQLIQENPESFASIHIEPVTGSNGILVPPADYMNRLRKLCDKYGILLVSDEVMTGFGRTGKDFAVQHWNVEPDIIVSAKGLTSAHLPLGIVGVSEKIAKMYDDKPFSGGLTYQAHPMCLAAAKGAMLGMNEEKATENSAKLGEVLKTWFEEMKQKHKCVGDVRNIGLFGCLELVSSRKTKQPMHLTGTNPMLGLGAKLKERGLLNFIFGSYLFVNPPLIVKENQLRAAMKIIDEELEAIDKHSTD